MAKETRRTGSDAGPAASPAPGPAGAPAPAGALAPVNPNPDPDAAEKAQLDALAAVGGARPTDSLSPRPADLPLEERARQELQTQTGGQGPEPGQAKDISPMPAGGPRDPAVAGGNTSRDGVSPVRGVDELVPGRALRSPQEGERTRTLVPTGLVETLGPRQLPVADNEEMVVVQTSYVKDVLRDAGSRISNFSGPYSGNLMKASDYDAKKGDAAQPNPDTSGARATG